MDIVLYGGGRDALVASDIKELTALAEEGREYALTLRDDEIRAVAAAHADSLELTGRVEVMGGLCAKLTDAFSVSPYFSQSDFAAGLCTLIAAFYHTKNESADRISDDELIDFMVTSFNGPCRGSVELLCERELPRLTEALTSGASYDPLEQMKTEEREYD